jgi:hypothetical protein
MNTGQAAIYHSRVGMWPAVTGVARILPWAIHPEKPSETVPIIRDVEHVIEAVDPDLIVLDVAFDYGADAVQRLRRNFVYLSPNTLKDLAMGAQGAGLFKIPWYAHRALPSYQVLMV